jgi:Putative MetA-pathway of phenol degradation
VTGAKAEWLRMRRSAVVALAGAAISGAAFAAHPLQTEDTGTQGAGNVELENGLSWSRADGTRTVAYQPQISYGLSPALDLIVQPSWLDVRGGDGARASGWGDTNLDAKWRFYGAAPLSFAVRAGATIATSEQGLGLPHGKVSTHALFVTTVDLAPFTVHANLGVAQNPGGSGERSRVGHVSAAVMWAPNERLTFTVDGGASSNPDATRGAWPATLLAGAIYTVRPGLDVDVGYQSAVAASVPSREWLVGVTYRFAP